MYTNLSIFKAFVRPSAICNSVDSRILNSRNNYRSSVRKNKQKSQMSPNEAMDQGVKSIFL
jgi:hypothetical protein